MRYKVLLVVFILMFLMFSFGLTYSYFTNEIDYIGIDQKVASFIFNTSSLDRLELPLTDLTPGETREYEFSVSNTTSNKTSDVTIIYQLTILTPHFTPLDIELYRGEEKVMTCDETYSRNNSNELVCNTETFELSHGDEETDDFHIKIAFDSQYNDLSYANLIDYLNVEIRSYQKV